MKVKIFILSLFIACSSAPPSTAPASLPAEDEPLKAQLLLRFVFQGFSEGHYKPLPTDDALSQKLFDSYMKRLDGHKRVFLQSDFDELARSRDGLDDQIKDGRYAFFRRAYELQTQREASIASWCEPLTESPFDFTVKEELVITPSDYPKDLEALKDRWRRTLKSWTLTKMVELLESQERSPSSPQKDQKAIEEESRSYARKQCVEIFTKLSNYELEERRADYLDAIAAVYDPHSGFFPPTAKANFDVQASGSFQGIGINLKESENNLVISQIISGSPADRDGGISVGDKLISVKRGDEEIINVAGKDAKETNLLLRADKGIKITIVIEKPDKSLKEFPLTSELILLEDTYAKAALFTRGKQKVALIDLHSFYADTSGAGGHKSTEDVAAILRKMKKDGVSQLILDLRGNVGGALTEATNVAGLFISKGPIVQLKGSGDQSKLYEDTDPETQFSGDLLILLDENSASSAEVLAAAMQDYQRATLVGGATTYGKGTAQRVISLDQLLPEDAKDLAPLGAIKITLEKFYRVSGGATQLKGVIPDVILPDQYSHQDTGEKLFDNPMPWDETTPVPFEKWKPRYDLKSVQEKSAARTKALPIFQLIDENAKRIKKINARESIPLQLEEYRAEKKRIDDEAKKYTGVLTPIKDAKISMLPSEKTTFAKLAPINKARVEKWQKQLIQDPYVEEALNILLDL